jgi:predicted amidohydrolase
VKDFRIALMQLNLPQAEGLDERISRIEAWTRSAANEGANVVWFGELAVTSSLLPRRTGSSTSPGSMECTSSPG